MKRCQYLWRRLWSIYNPLHTIPDGDTTTPVPYRIELRTAPLTDGAWQAAQAALVPPDPNASSSTTITSTSRIFSIVNQPRSGSRTDPSTSQPTTQPARGNVVHFDDKTAVTTSTVAPPPSPSYPPGIVTTQPSDRLPVLRTRSALGIVRAATREDWGIAEFVTPEQYDYFVHRVLNDANQHDVHLDFYRFRVDDKIISCPSKQPISLARLEAVPRIKKSPIVPRLSSEVRKLLRTSDSKVAATAFTFLEYNYCNLRCLDDWKYGETDLHDDDANLNGNIYLPRTATDSTQARQNEIGGTRHYIVIVVQSAYALPPGDAFVSYVYGDQRYYIKDEDYVSKKNFALIGQFLTMEAVPTGTGLTPTISVGGIGH